MSPQHRANRRLAGNYWRNGVGLPAIAARFGATADRVRQVLAEDGVLVVVRRHGRPIIDDDDHTPERFIPRGGWRWKQPYMRLDQLDGEPSR